MTAVEVALPVEPIYPVKVISGAMADGLSEQADVEPSFAERAKTFLALGYMSAGAFFAEQTHMTQELAQPWQAISESMAHPALGYVGAWLATTATQHGWVRRSAVTALATTTAIDGLVEEAQDIVFQAHGPEHWWAAAQHFETGKDYAFALGGIAVFTAQTRLKAWLQRRHEASIHADKQDAAK